MFILDNKLSEKVRKSISDKKIIANDDIFMCGCAGTCDGCNGCEGCATYGCYPDGWHDKYIVRITNERKAS